MAPVDQTVGDIVARPFDVSPPRSSRPPEGLPGDDAKGPSSDGPAAPPASDAGPFDRAARGGPSWGGPNATDRTSPATFDTHVMTASADIVQRGGPDQPAERLRQFELRIPAAIPGSETPLVRLPRQREDAEVINRLFPGLPPVLELPEPAPGPNGLPYTLEDLQRIAAANSPALRQAASDVEQARGQLIQAGLYPNPTIGYEIGPNANNTASSTFGFFADQVIKTGGKLKLQAAVAKYNLRAAELALRRARFDLATTIRGDYYSLLVAKETVRVNGALVRFTDEIFRLQADLMEGGFAASHEPAALRSQAFVVRLAHNQAVANYAYSWKQLVADMGLKQLPLSAVEGEIDRLIPNYDYDAALAHVLNNHTDVLMARANLEAARYGLKLAQVTPVPDVEVRADLWKENTVAPFQNFHALQVSIPFPVFDRNQGNIRSATAALVRAAEGPHFAEVDLTTRFANAYSGYRSNLYALEFYRRNILPDQVRYYRGVFERRKVDPNANFGDLVQAQQVLVQDVTAYLGVLATLWDSVVAVANFLQTEDLYQLGGPLELPRLPDFDALCPLPCPHHQVIGVAVPGPPTPDAPDPGAMASDETSAPKRSCEGPEGPEEGRTGRRSS
jgi:cobalt-zinc-cadmium efflux system outer membrane protein